jgi:hypothetical protein
MNEPARQLVERFRRESPLRHAAWEAELFEELVQGPGESLWKSLNEGVNNPTDVLHLFESWLNLIQEGMALGHVRQAGQGQASNLLELCLTQRIPQETASWSKEECLRRLADVWNLGEGLAQQPMWINRYVLTRVAELGALDGLEAFLVQVLGPVLSPPPPSDWKGSFHCTVLNPRDVDDDFLPGEMRLIAPVVAAVRDRLRDVTLGVMLEKQGRSRFLGPLAGLDGGYDEAPAPAVVLQTNGAKIGGRKVDLPLLTTPYRSLAARTGFVVAGAVDSQRLWVVECS